MKDGLELTIELDKTSYKVSDPVVILYTLRNIGHQDLRILPWGGEYATNWIKGFVVDSRGETGLEIIHEALYELKLIPERDDFIVLKPNEAFTRRFLARILDGIPAKKISQNHSGFVLDFEDSAILLEGSGRYLLQGYFEGKDRWSQEGERRFGFNDVFVGKVTSQKVVFIVLHELEKRFLELYSQWQEYIQRPSVKLSSKTSEYVDCKPYKEIVNLGDEVLPYLIRKMEEGKHASWNEGQFFLWYAVREISGVDLVGQDKVVSEQEAAERYVSWWSNGIELQQIGSNPSTKQESTYSPEEAIKTVADRKVRSLGMDTAQMVAQIKKEKEGWSVYYAPASSPGTVIMGGDLTVYLNDDGEVINVFRGQ